MNIIFWTLWISFLSHFFRDTSSEVKTYSQKAIVDAAPQDNQAEILDQMD